MEFPKNILSGLCETPDFYLCETDKSLIGFLHTYEQSGTFKFNAYSEITLSVPRQLMNLMSGSTFINPLYDLVSGLRFIFIPSFGYFQIQSADIYSDGIEEYKEVTAYSAEYDLSQKYLENFIINKGIDGSIDGDVILYNAEDLEHSLLHLVLEKAPHWHIGHVDDSLKTLKRIFDVDRTTIYDFIMNDMAETFKFYTVFDTFNNTINLYVEDEVGKDTDIYVSLDTIASEVEVKYNLDDIKTVLTVTGADDIDIRSVNMGLPYIMDLSYYNTVEWMGQDLYDAYNKYVKKLDLCTTTHKTLMSRWNELYAQKDELYNLVPDYEEDTDITEVNSYSSLPVASIEYYGRLYKVNNPNDPKGIIVYVCNSYTDEYGATKYRWDIATDEYGINLLKEKEEVYKNIQQVQAESGWSEKDNSNYSRYAENYKQLTDIQTLLKDKQELADLVQERMDDVVRQIDSISANADISNNFTEGQILRLTPFMREDEYSDDNFVITSLDTDKSAMELKQELKKTASEELAKISQPQLEFTMKMANVYAIPEFAPIKNQFENGNSIHVIIRPGYYASVRILQIDLSFNDLSNFQVSFGNLAAFRSQTDIHADLLKQAASAGKSVASNSSNWQKGYDKATETDVRIQNGLIDATTSIKSDSAGQSVEWDNYGIHLKKLKEGSTTEYEPDQVWMTNNKILFSDDAFESSKTLLGKFTVDGGKTYNYGLIAEAVLGGYIEGSHMVGGTIKIGKQPDGSYAFEVHEDGSVTMGGGSGGIDMSGYATKDELKQVEDKVEDISTASMYRVEVQFSGPSIMTKKNQTATLTCKVYSWDSDITDTLDASLFNWVRYSNDYSQDAIWNNNTIHKGRKTLTISTEDIQNNANFNCEISLPD